MGHFPNHKGEKDGRNGLVREQESEQQLLGPTGRAGEMGK